MGNTLQDITNPQLNQGDEGYVFVVKVPYNYYLTPKLSHITEIVARTIIKQVEDEFTPDLQYKGIHKIGTYNSQLEAERRKIPQLYFALAEQEVKKITSVELFHKNKVPHTNTVHEVCSEYTRDDVTKSFAYFINLLPTTSTKLYTYVSQRPVEKITIKNSTHKLTIKFEHDTAAMPQAFIALPSHTTFSNTILFGILQANIQYNFAPLRLDTKAENITIDNNKEITLNKCRTQQIMCLNGTKLWIDIIEKQDYKQYLKD